jgi:phycocyanobilin:ferredoxin oxidoreductase
MLESKVWHELIAIEKRLEAAFYSTGSIINEPGMDRFNQPGWINKVWKSSRYRRAHIDVVDARDTKGLWMMHCCVFPHLDNPAPIFGFDVIAGKNKMTGCFIDYSPSSDRKHPMIEYFADEVSRYDWHKPRALPDWAQRIFSPHMVAAGNVSDEQEIKQISSLANILINHYLECVSDTAGTANEETVKTAQNYYAQNQKQNPHTPKVMTSLGLNEDDVQVFIQECLFPELKYE